MDDKIFEFVEWIFQHYGRVGCLVFMLIIIVVLVLIFFLLSRLPEPKKIIVWSKCSSCKYKCKNKNLFVLKCSQYERPRWNQFRSPPCPIADNNKGCVIVQNRSNPSLFNREDVPDDMK